MADIKPVKIIADGSLAQMEVGDTIDGRDISTDGTDQDTHISDGTIHSKLYVQATEPVSWNTGDIWIEIP